MEEVKRLQSRLLFEQRLEEVRQELKAIKKQRERSAFKFAVFAVPVGSLGLATAILGDLLGWAVLVLLAAIKFADIYHFEIRETRLKQKRDMLTETAAREERSGMLRDMSRALERNNI